MNNIQYKPKYKKQKEQFTDINSPCIQSYIQKCKYYQKDQKCFLHDSPLNYMHNNQPL